MLLKGLEPLYREVIQLKSIVSTNSTKIAILILLLITLIIKTKIIKEYIIFIPSIEYIGGYREDIRIRILLL